MTQAQKIAKDKFKKAIEYRKKTGASLKEAFAFVYGRKVSPEKKKAAPKKKAASKKVGAIKIIEKGENKNTKTKATYQQIRTKKGTYKGLKKVAGIKVVAGFVGRLIVKTFTISELKKMNPIYFEKGKDKSAGVYKRKLIISKKLESQVMVEAQKDSFTNLRSYVVRLINAEGSIGIGKRFDTIYSAAEYIGKNIIL